ncbi:hypothetical protein [uncultured Chryseobacterium sp.]|jgi:hypothetical protein|uniref:hypothetical protein n=1 Tax=uncultured Chryseobacterium sp. TaxID=259322 RepID=UPI002628BC82|nr:hypothetical protein [uncultured Chryseobacterium sp.]
MGDLIDAWLNSSKNYFEDIDFTQFGADTRNETINEVANVKQQKETIDLVELFDVTLKNKIGTRLKAEDIIRRYKLSPKLKDAINSITVLQGNKVEIDWKNETAINMFSKINVHDGKKNVYFIT